MRHRVEVDPRVTASTHALIGARTEGPLAVAGREAQASASKLLVEVTERHGHGGRVSGVSAAPGDLEEHRAAQRSDQPAVVDEARRKCTGGLAVAREQLAAAGVVNPQEHRNRGEVVIRIVGPGDIPVDQQESRAVVDEVAGLTSL